MSKCWSVDSYEYFLKNYLCKYEHYRVAEAFDCEESCQVRLQSDFIYSIEKERLMWVCVNSQIQNRDLFLTFVSAEFPLPNSKNQVLDLQYDFFEFRRKSHCRSRFRCNHTIDRNEMQSYCRFRSRSKHTVDRHGIILYNDIDM